MNYSVINYQAANSENEIGEAMIQVTGCVKYTYIDIPYGIVQGDAAWNSLVDEIVNDVKINMDPLSPTYDPSLLGE